MKDKVRLRTLDRTLRRSRKRQRDLTERLIWLCFNEHLINYGWKEGGRNKKKEKKNTKIRIKKDQSNTYEV